MSGKRLSYSIENEWIRVNFLYEEVPEIKSAPECELRVRSITSKLPLSLSEGYRSDTYGVYILQDLKDQFPYHYDYYYGSRMINIDDVWYLTIGYNGASYFYESSKNTSKDDLTFKKIIEEAYNYLDGITIHEKIEVTYYNYIDYYNSLPTTIEKNEADRNYSDIVGSFGKASSSFSEYIYYNVQNYGIRRDLDFCTSVGGIGNCLLKFARLL